MFLRPDLGFELGLGIRRNFTPLEFHPHPKKLCVQLTKRAVDYQI